MSFTPPELRTHAQKVCTLYKQILRTIESYYRRRHVIRYHSVIMRDRFDQNMCVSDPLEQRRLLFSAQKELFDKQNPLPLAKFSRSYGLCAGTAAGRVVTPPDWVFDYWHPLEKARYPKYFETREERKCEFLEKYEKGEIY